MFESRYLRQEESQAIWIFVEQHDGVLEKVAGELLGKGRQLADDAGWELAGILLGSGSRQLARRVISLGADRVLLAENPLLERFSEEVYAAAIYQMILERKPSVFLLGATPGGRDLAGRLAVRLRTGLNADCTDLHLKPHTGTLVCEVSGYGGGILALIEMEQHRPQMATVRQGVFPVAVADPDRRGEVESLRLEVDQPGYATRLVERVVGQGVDLSAAPVLVAGGRGIEGRFDMLYELAALLGGDVGATRPPVDEGFVERERQIGQTGVVCRPKVALVCGASGAFHFVVGIQEADVVIAINTDPQAPIFDYADYYVIDDAQAVLAALIEVLRSEDPGRAAETSRKTHA